MQRRAMSNQWNLKLLRAASGYQSKWHIFTEYSPTFTFSHFSNSHTPVTLGEYQWQQNWTDSSKLLTETLFSLSSNVANETRNSFKRLKHRRWPRTRKLLEFNCDWFGEPSKWVTAIFKSTSHVKGWEHFRHLHFDCDIATSKKLWRIPAKNYLKR